MARLGRGRPHRPWLAPIPAPTAFFAASAPGSTVTSGTLSLTVPAGVTPDMYCLAVIGGDSGTGLSATPTMPGLATYTTFLAVTTATNTQFLAFKMTGLTGGDVVTFAVPKPVDGQLFAFKTDLSAAGSVTVRSVSQTTVTAPAITATAAQQVFVLGVERTTAVVSVASMTNSLGYPVTNRAESNVDSNADVGFALGEYTATSAGTTGTSTITWSGGSTNGGGLHFASVAAVPPPPADPVATMAALVNANGAGTLQGGWWLDSGASCRMVVSTSSDLSSPTYSSSASPTAGSKAVAMSVTGLTEGTLYYVGIEVDGTLLTTGRGQGRTLATARAGTTWTFGAGSCNTTGSTRDVFTVIDAEGYEFFMHMGDRHYADTSVESTWRAAHKTSMTTAPFQDLLTSTPMTWTPDNHDWGGNRSWRDSPVGAFAYTAITETMLGYAASGAFYRTYVHRGVRFIELDRWSQRDKDSAGTSSDGDASAPKDPADATKVMLGATQEAWFLNLLSTSTEELIIINSGFPLTNARLGPYAVETTRIKNYIAALPARQKAKLIALGGDSHDIRAATGAAAIALWGIPTLNASPLDQTGGPFDTTGWDIGQLDVDYAYGYWNRCTITDTGTDITFRWDAMKSNGSSLLNWSTTVTPTTTVGKTTATGWGVRQVVTDSSATIWNVATAVADSTATTWPVRQQVSDSTVTSWSVRAGIGKTVATTWNTQTTVTLPAALAEWPFSEGSGTTATDVIGGKVLDLEAAVWGTGHTGGGLHQAGGGRGAFLAWTNPTTAITLACWYKPDSGAAVLGTQQIVGFMDSADGGNSEVVIWAQRSDFGPPGVLQGNLRAGGGLADVADTALTDDVWVHLALTYDGAAIVLYRDGVAVNSLSRSGTITAGTHFFIGSSSTSGTATNGTVDDVRVYDTALTQPQIALAASTPVAGTALTSVGKTTATSWAVRGVVADSAATSWDVRAGIVKTTATAWGVRSGIAKTSVTTWVVQAQVTDSASTTWDTWSRVQDSTATAWNVRAGVAKIIVAGWDVAATIVDSTNTSWAVRALVVDTAATSWAARQTVIDSAATSWDVTGVPGIAGKSTATGWAVRQAVTKTSGTSWAVRVGAAKNSATTWAVRMAVADTAATSWNVQAQVTDTAQTRWDAWARVTDTAGTSWNIAAITSSTVGTTTQTSWAVRGGAGKTAQTQWDIHATVLKNITTTWSTGGTTVLGQATSWNVASGVGKTFSTTWNVTLGAAQQVSTSWATAGYVTDTQSTTWNVLSNAVLGMAHVRIGGPHGRGAQIRGPRVHVTIGGPRGSAD